MGELKGIRVRFAPSPTGELHIGSLRTTLTNFLFARKNNGTFILRIEDTDQKRFVDGAVERLIDSLTWAGITIDEGVKIDESTGVVIEDGPCGPYIQSKRLAIYQEYVQQLLDSKKAYHCFCTSERLQEMRALQQARKESPKYDRHCCALTQEEVQAKLDAGEKYVVRFKIPEGVTAFDDLIFGHIEVNNDTLDDQVLMKSDGFPTYHLAVVVDDHLMEISHVIRATEWLASTPKHVLLYDAFGWKEDMPAFCHVAPILNKDRKKLSKREGSVSVHDFREQGYPKEALINFIALLGWNPKTEQEIFTTDELIAQFDIAKMNRAGGVFDVDRLNWISREHIKRMSIDELYREGVPFLEQKDFYKNAKLSKHKEDFIKRLLTVEQDRLDTFVQIGEANQFFFTDEIAVDKDLLRWKENDDDATLNVLKQAQTILANITEEDWTRENLEKLLMSAAGEKRGDFLWPLRAALTGEKRSPSPFDCAWVLGRGETLARIEQAIALF
jgi:nondiscriminating glutamyl-tRNA synthetase